MKRVAGSPRRRTVARKGGGLLQAGGAIVARNPVAVGGAMAFFVTFSFVSANALWYQPSGHPAAFFPTRPLQFERAPSAETAPIFTPPPRPKSAEPADRGEKRAAGDPVVLEVQDILANLKLYEGPVDGIAGPQTRDAIRHYQRVVGLEQSGAIDDRLLRHLGATGSIAPPVPKSRPSIAAAAPGDEERAETGGAVVKRIQAGLKAFGNDQIEIDGIAGKQTEAAVREFQALFGLEVTGRADETVLAKMRDLGLAD